ncbi:type II toxin-antitoxin system Phd/YefM family antitoxin [Secundilactobacillus yichangensis]|uniref:type II toxin-antitoxin system Phd/YefM family antitoxin n=1 Tax=Secundilactobacillus yichangensis TaxID=2799580 RepID=UPI001940623B|nr:type II toxin-antitoxin system Phd/YefM family antitoxin [Secundilactobacillus yichangensis]
MDTVTYSDFRRNLKAYIQKVNDDSDSLIVTSKKPHNSVVIMNKHDYDAMQETMYILSNPELMNRIREGDEQFATDNGHSHI